MFPIVNFIFGKIINNLESKKQKYIEMFRDGKKL